MYASRVSFSDVDAGKAMLEAGDMALVVLTQKDGAPRGNAVLHVMGKSSVLSLSGAEPDEKRA